MGGQDDPTDLMTCEPVDLCARSIDGMRHLTAEQCGGWYADGHLEGAIAELQREGEGIRATTQDIEQWAGSLRELIRREGLR